jgi:YaiO family outer membrane protein
MSQTLHYTCRHLLAIATTALPLCSYAQPDMAVPAHRSLEIYASRNTLSNGYGKWHEAGVRGKYAIDNHLLGAELATMRRFGESGQYFGVSDTITLNADWFTSVSVGAGDGAAYLPDYRADAFIHRKLLPSRQLVASLGAGYYRAPDDHIDRNISLGATYYFEAPWVLQGEIRFNRSNPGQVRTHQQFLAATWGQEHHTRVVLRHGWGAEGYQAIGGGASLVNFDSRQSQLNVQHWLGRQWGINMGVERYSNPFYARKGITLALFWKLP